MAKPMAGYSVKNPPTNSVSASAKSKGALEGFISFKQSFSAYFLTIFLGILISTAVSYIIFNFIDPAAADVLKEKTIETTVSMMEGFGAPAESIKETVDQMEAQNTFSIGNLLKGLAFQLVLYKINLVVRRAWHLLFLQKIFV